MREIFRFLVAARRRYALRGATGILAFCLLWNGVALAQPNDFGDLRGLREYLGPAIRVQKRHLQRLLAERDIVGAAVGLTANGEPAIKVFTKSQAIMSVPQKLDGFPVEIEMTGEFQSAARLDRESSSVDAGRARRNSARIFARPVPVGVSAGNERECSSGTIAARVIDGTGRVYALSNNHVFALENTAPINSNILQPGLANVRCQFMADNVIAKLSRYAEIDFSRTATNTVDAAIAATSSSLLGNATPRNGFGAPDSETVSAFVGQKVQKYGERTRLTRGQVKAINATVLVEYDSGTARFTNQIVVGSPEVFIRAGDSGSLLVTRSGAHPVGLLFAGAKGGRTAIANPINSVLNALGVSIDGE
ncbi:MAG TPA: hypothetical protein VNO43_03405 [Candidatus Eisenbacteria bacterium]|nr:hypothetical protein [Candidatus Eisenbacteria bacterium]